MSDSELQSYIKQCRDQGMSDESIRQTLQDAGWAQQDLDWALDTTSSASILKPNKPKRKHRIVKTALVTLGVIFGFGLLAIFLPSILGRIVPDSPPENTTDLALATLAIPNDQNAFADGARLERLAQDTFSSSIVAYAKGEQWDDLQIQAMLARNEAALALFDETLRKPSWQVPPYSSPNVTTEVVPITIWRTMSSLAIIQSRQRAKEGHVDEAIPQLVRIARLGHTVQTSQSDLIEYLVGLSIQNMAADALAEIAPQIQNPVVASSARQALATLNVDATNMLKTEYAYWLKTNQEMLETRIPLFTEGALRYRAYQNGYTFQPVTTANKLAQVVRNFIVSAQSPCDYTPQQTQPVDVSPLLYYQPNGFGEEMVQSFLPALNTTMKKTCETQTKTQAAIDALNK